MYPEIFVQLFLRERRRLWIVALAGGNERFTNGFADIEQRVFPARAKVEAVPSMPEIGVLDDVVV